MHGVFETSLTTLECKNWCSEGHDHDDMRRCIMEEILMHFADFEDMDMDVWGEMMPALIQQVEYYLYSLASSKAEYENLATLPQRIEFVCHRFRSMCDTKTQETTMEDDNSLSPPVKRRRCMTVSTSNLTATASIVVFLRKNEDIAVEIIEYLTQGDQIQLEFVNRFFYEHIPSTLSRLVIRGGQMENFFSNERNCERHSQYVRQIAVLEGNLNVSFASFSTALKRGYFKQLKEIEFDHCFVYLPSKSHTNMKDLSMALAYVPCLEALSLRQNFLGDDGVTCIAELIKKCIHLKLLDVSDNYIGTSGVVALSKALPESVKILEMGYNVITDKCIDPLINRLTKLKSFHSLGLEKNFCSPKRLEEMVFELGQTSSLRT